MNPKPIKFIRRKLGKEQAWGQQTGGRLEIDERLRGRKELEICIHESLHYLCEYMSEEEVIRVSAMLTRALWSDKWRRIDDSEHLPLQDE
jgi:hypothetical protein